MLVHIDPEDDLVADEAVYQGALDRATLAAWLEQAAERVWGAQSAWAPERVQLHYLNGRVEVEIMLPPAPGIDPEPAIIEQGVRALQAAAEKEKLPLDSWVVYRRLSA